MAAVESEGLRSSALLSELNVKFKDFEGSTPKVKSKKFNKKLKLYRELVLASLSCMLKSKTVQCGPNTTEVSCEDASPQLPVLDSLAASGVAGMQWKKSFGADVHVTMADHDDLSLLTSNAELNCLKACRKTLDASRLQGDPVPAQGDTEVNVCQAEAKTLMSNEAFKFIYLNPHKHCMAYFDSAFNSISNRGIICAVISDVSMFARAPKVTRRYYSADVIKTEYLKECAARIVLANLAISAAKCNKGISPLYVVSLEDFLLVGVKVIRGHSEADNCLSEIRQLLHCRICEERVFLPPQLAPLDEPYQLLLCQCNSNTLGKTAVILGPMWQGQLFDHAFLNQLCCEGKSLKLSSQFFTTCSLLLEESLCTASQSSKPSSTNILQNMTSLNTNSSTPESTISGKLNESERLSNSALELSKSASNGNSQCEKTEHELSSSCQNGNSSSSDVVKDPSSSHPDAREQSLKRSAYCEAGDKEVKRQRVSFSDTDVAVECCPTNIPFYQHVSKFKKTNVPKLNRLVTILKSLGYRASRTHFDPCAVRTSASVQQFKNCLHESQ